LVLIENILIFGTGGHAKVIVDIIEKQGKFNIAGFIGGYHEKNTVTMGYKVKGDESSLKDIVFSYKIYGGIIGIGGGSLVCNDAKDNSVYYGSPCKFIREHKFGDKYLT